MNNILYKTLFFILIVVIGVSCSFNNNEVVEKKVEEMVVRDSLISSIEKDNERIEKRIINDTVVIIRYIDNRLFDKKYILNNGNVLISNFNGSEKAGSTYQLDSNKNFVSYEYWIDGEKVFRCEYNSEGIIENVEGTVFIKSINNSTEVKVGDTLWVNTFVIPIPKTKYTRCNRNNIKDELMCADFFRTNGIEPIVDYILYDGKEEFEMEYFYSCIDKTSNKKIDSFKFSVVVE